MNTNIFVFIIPVFFGSKISGQFSFPEVILFCIKLSNVTIRIVVDLLYHFSERKTKR